METGDFTRGRRSGSWSPTPPSSCSSSLLPSAASSMESWRRRRSAEESGQGISRTEQVTERRAGGRQYWVASDCGPHWTSRHGEWRQMIGLRRWQFFTFLKSLVRAREMRIFTQTSPCFFFLRQQGTEIKHPCNFYRPPSKFLEHLQFDQGPVYNSIIVFFFQSSWGIG